MWLYTDKPGASKSIHEDGSQDKARNECDLAY